MREDIVSQQTPRYKHGVWLHFLCLIAAKSALLLATLPAQGDPIAPEAASTIERGRYLAQAGNCKGCHTVPGSPAFSGGVAFKTDFGVLYSTNISPDKTHGIGNWSLSDFDTAMRHGKRPNGEHLYPVFPYTAFTGMSEQDIAALYTYLRKQAPVATPTQANALSFPFNQRALLAIWKRLFFAPLRLEPSQDKSTNWNRGAYLVNAVTHCGLCHTPKNLLGADKRNQALSGARYLDQVVSGAYRPWFAVDLTPSDSGLDAWQIQDIASYLKTGFNRFSTAYGPMKTVIADSTRHISDSDIHAMSVYLKDLPKSDHNNPKSSRESSFTQRGAALYSIHCATCHLPNGLGSNETGPSLVGNPVVEGRDPSSLINVILYGPDLPEMELPVQRTQMDDYKDLLSDEDIALLTNYIRSAWGNHAAPVAAQAVATQR